MYTCKNCDFSSTSWYGRCPECGEFNTLIETVQKKDKKKSSTYKKAILSPLSSFKSHDKTRIKTGIFEIDRVLGGGFVGGEVVLLAGEPGVGKSTLLLGGLPNLRVVYVSGEESAEQLRSRADRLATSVNNMLYCGDTDIDAVITMLRENAAGIDLVIIDSVQTMFTRDINAPPGGPGQIREVTSRLVDFAKENYKPLVIVGHVTKEGEIAGPKTLEHFVDCVLYLEGEKRSQLRLLRSQKNRFGTTDEVGIFEMSAKGLNEIKEPTAFLESNPVKAIGKVIVGIPEGSRAVFFEVQSLVTPTSLAMPRRIVSGVDYNKVQLILAVLRKNLNISLESFDVYINVVGGVNVRSTGADLGIAVSVVSSIKNLTIDSQLVFVGEIGLLGEVRQVYGQEKIIKEAARYNFKKVFSSKNIATVKEIMSVFR